MACSNQSYYPPQIPIHQAIDTVVNIRRSSSNVKIGSVSKVVSAANESQILMIWTIPEYPAPDTLVTTTLLQGMFNTQPINTERKQSLRKKTEEEAAEKNAAQNQTKIDVQADTKFDCNHVDEGRLFVGACCPDGE